MVDNLKQSISGANYRHWLPIRIKKCKANELTITVPIVLKVLEIESIRFEDM